MLAFNDDIRKQAPQLCSESLTQDTSLLIALATLALAGIAWTQARAAKVSAEAIMNSERAWVIVDADVRTKPTEPRPGKTADFFSFFVWNAGKTPARVTFTRSESKVIESIAALPDIAVYASGNPGTKSNSMLAPVPPTQMGSFNIIMRGPEFDRRLFDTLLNGQLFLYAHGRIKYMDTFGNPRYTTFGFCWHAPMPGDILSGQWVRTGPQSYNECT